jgi:AcrR family transcriptional regulator
MSHRALSATRQHQAICTAARSLFSRYGYRRVSLEDIAREAGMSRSGIYNYFRNKEEILKTVVQEIGYVSHQRAEAAAKSDAPLVLRLQQIFEAKLVDPYAELHGMPHGEVLTDQKTRVTDQLIETWAMNFMSLVAKVLKKADKSNEINLAQVDLTPNRAALYLVLCARGLKTSGSVPLDPEEYRKRIRKLIEVNLLGFGGANKPSR